MAKAIKLAITTTLLLLPLVGQAGNEDQSNQSISGTLKYLKAENGETFLALDADKIAVTKSDEGQLLRSKLVQLAGLSSAQLDQATSLIGKRITLEGRPMGRHTVHHHTDVLWLCKTITEDKGTSTSSTSPNDNKYQNEDKPQLDDDSKNESNSEKVDSHSLEWK